MISNTHPNKNCSLAVGKAVENSAKRKTDRRMEKGRSKKTDRLKTEEDLFVRDCVLQEGESNIGMAKS
jgi:hypothetical protein